MKKIKLYHYFIGLILISITTFALSVEPEEFMKDPKKELRAREISKNIRARSAKLRVMEKISEGK